MQIENNSQITNQITVDGITFTTNGNILFSDSEDTSYFIANNSRLKEMECFLEHGVQLLLKQSAGA